MTILNEPIITFIVPVYNVELYVEKCLLSIIHQSLKNIEVIVVNDGSTDSSLDICNRLAMAHKILRIFSKENEGQGVARNFGLSKAHGEYICYVDSDDWLDPLMAEEVVEIVSREKADFANFGINFISEDDRVVKVISNFSTKELHGSEIFLDALIDKNILSVSWNKIYRRSFLLDNEILFPPFRANEDLFYSRAVSFFATKSVFISKTYYHALVRTGSTSRNMSIEMFNISVDLIKYEQKIFAERLTIEPCLRYFNAHIVKFLSYILIQSAFRIPVYSEYRSCFDVVNRVNYRALGAHKATLSVLTRKGRFMVFLCRRPILLRALATLVKKLGFSSFVY